MHKIFNKKQILTIPNMLSFFRLALVPLILWVYVGLKDYILAIILIAVSGLTDVVDGKIARHFNMVSDFGKILDPIADKVTQGCLIICLTTKFKLMIPLILLFAVKEGIMFFMGYLVYKRKDSVNSSKWHGKLTTVLLYSVTVLLIMIPTIPETVANIMIIACGGMIIFSLIEYALFYKSILKSEE